MVPTTIKSSRETFLGSKHFFQSIIVVHTQPIIVQAPLPGMKQLKHLTHIHQESNPSQINFNTMWKF